MEMWREGTDVEGMGDGDGVDRPGSSVSFQYYNIAVSVPRYNNTPPPPTIMLCIDDNNIIIYSVDLLFYDLSSRSVRTSIIALPLLRLRPSVLILVVTAIPILLLLLLLLLLLSHDFSAPPPEARGATVSTSAEIDRYRS